MELLSGLLLFGILSIPFLVLFYNRTLRNFNSEIINYLNDQSLTLEVKRKPKDSDWKTSPFSKPHNISLSIGLIKTGATNSNISEKKYLIIETVEKRTFWCEIETTFPFGYKLIFKEPLSPLKPREKSVIGNQPTTKCPACGYPTIESDLTCPDCELRLK